MSDGGAGALGMTVRYRRKDGTWVSPAARREASGWWWPAPEDFDGTVEITGGGGAPELAAREGSGYGGGE